MLDPNEVRYLDNQLANERIRLPNRTPHNITPKPSSIPPLQPGIRHHLRTSVHNTKRRPVGTGLSPRGGHRTIGDATFADQLPLPLGTPHAGNSSLLLEQG